MPPVKCPDCEKPISSLAKTCVHCGYPIADHATVGPELHAQKEFLEILKEADSIEASEDRSYHIDELVALWCRAAILAKTHDIKLPGRPHALRCLQSAADVLRYPSIDSMDCDTYVSEEYLRAHLVVLQDPQRTADIVFDSDVLCVTDAPLDIVKDVGKVASAMGTQAEQPVLAFLTIQLDGLIDDCKDYGSTDYVTPLMAIRTCALENFPNSSEANDLADKCTDVVLRYGPDEYDPNADDLDEYDPNEDATDEDEQDEDEKDEDEKDEDDLSSLK